MGRPRLIILIRHAQSEGNKNRDIHQYIPDHRVKLTSDGWDQAEDAGHRLKSLLRKDDTIRIFTSPYRRTRETTEGILRTLTADDEENGASPFKRENIKVYEEPRLREQDFGNFQPCSIEMERMWQERADYGHFFYRIPDGESAADAYDRISGFNESLWRQFGDEDFPSVCILVTHGLMTRVFLMKWYHWSVEYFEDLRNIHHCEFITMERGADNAKYELKTQLRTWSELHQRNDSNGGDASPPSPTLPARQWGGCAMGCNHHKMVFPRKTKRQSTLDLKQPHHHTTTQEIEIKVGSPAPSRSRSVKRFDSNIILHEYEKAAPKSEKRVEIQTNPASSSEDEDVDTVLTLAASRHLHIGRDGGGSMSGLGSPANVSDDSDIDVRVRALNKNATPVRSNISRAAFSQLQEGNGKRHGESPSRTGHRQGSTHSIKTEKEWAKDSGMRSGKKADALGDVEDDADIDGEDGCLEQAVEDGRLDPSEGTAKGDVY